MQRAAMNEMEVKRNSLRVCRSILALPEFVSASSVALYAAFSNEINLETIVIECERQGKRVLLPRFDRVGGAYEMVPITSWSADCVPGRLGILEPSERCESVASETLRESSILWLVPGVGFDRCGVRLGFGKGHYDRMLSGTSGCRVGVCHDFQVVDGLPSTATDVPMDLVVSEKAVLRMEPTA